MTESRSPAPARTRSRIRRILLATDLTPASEAAARHAIDLAADLGAAILAVSIIDPQALRLPGGGYRRRVDQVRASREVAVQALVTRCRDVGIDADFLIWDGDPGDAILEAARAEEVDLIVVGSRGLGRAGRFVTGSVSDHVVRHAQVPVLVVRPAAGDR